MSNSPQKLFLKLIHNFDLATSLFRSFEVSSVLKVLNSMEVNAPILDLGCAEGKIAKEIFSKSKIYGLDYSIDFLKKADQLNLYSALFVADIRKMPFGDNVFVFLFSNSVLEHIQNIELVLKETTRILKPGGKILFTVPNENFKNQLFFYKMLNGLGMPGLASKYSIKRNKLLSHFNLYSQAKWKEIVNGCGLEAELMQDYVPGIVLAFWDLIASIQKIFKVILFIFLKIPIIKQILSVIGYILKVLAAYLLLPFFIIFNRKSEINCATIIRAVKK